MTREDKMICHHCDYECEGEDLSVIKQHIVQVHYTCEVCGHIARGKSWLKEHYNRSHMKYRKFKCDKCDFATYGNRTLQSQKICSHQEKDIKCDKCNFKTQAQKPQLNGRGLLIPSPSLVHSSLSTERCRSRCKNFHRNHHH